jgi:hypothetical protein
MISTDSVLAPVIDVSDPVHAHDAGNGRPDQHSPRSGAPPPDQHRDSLPVLVDHPVAAKPERSEKP